MGRSLVLYKATEHKILELARNLGRTEIGPIMSSLGRTATRGAEGGEARAGDAGHVPILQGA